MGQGIQFFYFLESKTDNRFSIRFDSMKLVKDYIEDSSQFYILGSDFIMQNKNVFITWRSSYIKKVGVEEFLKKQAMCKYSVSVYQNTPLLNAKSSKNEDQISAELNFNTNKITIKTTYMECSCNFKSKKVDGEKNLKRVMINNLYMPLLSVAKVIELHLYKRMIRVCDKRWIVDIGGIVDFE